ncbi:MAG: hypothetical protein POELPBGB_00639 [Bacteroidia bacterium]|nr:hypothetical protein [Bacteroidia bacterium]
MDSIGDVIYVIAIIGYIIYSFVSGAKKVKGKKKEVDETTTHPDAEPDIKKVLEELLGKAEQSKPQPAPVYETRKPSIEPVYETITEEGQSMEGKALNPVENYEFGKYKTLESEAEDEEETASKYEQFNSLNYSEQTAAHSIAEKEGIKDEIHLAEEKETGTIAKDFDIEKAIIYSEILKRPKWAA